MAGIDIEGPVDISAIIVQNSSWCCFRAGVCGRRVHSIGQFYHGRRMGSKSAPAWPEARFGCPLDCGLACTSRVRTGPDQGPADGGAAQFDAELAASGRDRGWTAWLRGSGSGLGSEGSLDGVGEATSGEATSGEGTAVADPVPSSSRCCCCCCCCSRGSFSLALRLPFSNFQGELGPRVWVDYWYSSGPGRSDESRDPRVLVHILMFTPFGIACSGREKFSERESEMAASWRCRLNERQKSDRK